MPSSNPVTAPEIKSIGAIYLVAAPNKTKYATTNCAILFAAAPAKLNPMHETRFFNHRCTPSMVRPEASDPAAENAKM